MALMIERYRAGGYGDPDGIPCPYFDSIFHLELAQPQPGTWGQICDYWLGERIYLDLFNTLRYEHFYQGFRAFHSMLGAQYSVIDTEYGATDAAPSPDPPAIDLMMEAFHATALNETESSLINAVMARRYGTVLFTDRSPVNPYIPELRGRVVGVHLVRINPTSAGDPVIVESHDGFFSLPASRIVGSYRLALVIAYEEPLPVDTELDFAVVEYYEDGFVFDRTAVTRTFAAGRPGSVTILAGIGFISNFRWPTGLYWVYAYHGDQKVGELFFDVAP